MSDATNIVMTDDEMLAISHLSGVSWTRPLATVDVTHPTQLHAAVGRGLRSLSLRGLVAATGELSPDVAPATVVCRGQVRLAATWVDSTFAQLVDDERFELAEGPEGDWCAVTVAPGGVHVIVPVTLGDALGFFAGLAATSSRSSGTPTFCVVGRGGPTFSAGVTCTEGATRRLALDAAGDVQESEPVDLDEAGWDAEIRRIMGLTAVGAG